MFPPSPGFISPGSDFTMTAELQHQSVLFGKLPREIRDMVYLAMWDVSGTQQHVFEHEDGSGDVTHFPCILAAGETDSRNDEFETMWHKQQARRPRSLVEDPVWARRMSSTWNEHWKCEEAMLARMGEGRKSETLFLPSLLTCRRMYDEALPTLYASTTLVLTSLPLAHHLLVAAPSPNTRLWRAARLSLTVPYEQLHRHRTNDYAGRPSTAPHRWAELCGALSNLVRFAALRAVALRLDVADTDRFWWEVRERWVLSPVRGRLARCLVLQLPELTADVDTMRPYHFIPPTPCSSIDELSGGEDDGPAVATAATTTTATENWNRYTPLWISAAATSPQRGPAEETVRDTEYPSASTTPSPETPPSTGSGSGSDSLGVPPIPFMRLERYQRRRWSREPVGDGVQARLEFFNPREHKVLGRERRREKIRGLFRGLLMM
ncbi:hypothetical protein PG988_004286 [Apiospora saccharicola]